MLAVICSETYPVWSMIWCGMLHGCDIHPFTSTKSNAHTYCHTPIINAPAARNGVRMRNCLRRFLWCGQCSRPKWYARPHPGHCAELAASFSHILILCYSPVSVRAVDHVWSACNYRGWYQGFLGCGRVTHACRGPERVSYWQAFYFANWLAGQRRFCKASCTLSHFSVAAIATRHGRGLQCCAAKGVLV